MMKPTHNFEVPRPVLKSVPNFRPTFEPANRQHTHCPPLATVADFTCARVVRLPAWFTAAQALRVAELRDVDHVLVEEQGQVRGALARTELSRARAAEPLARLLRRSDLVISPTTSPADARALMEARGLTCLPVVLHGLLLGTVTLEALDRPATAAA